MAQDYMKTSRREFLKQGMKGYARRESKAIVALRATTDTNEQLPARSTSISMMRRWRDRRIVGTTRLTRVLLFLPITSKIVFKMTLIAMKD